MKVFNFYNVIARAFPERSRRVRPKQSKLFRDCFAMLAMTVMLFACTSQSNEKIPEEILPAESMEKILTDMHLVEGFLTTRPLNMDSLNRIAVGYRDAIYEKHNTTHQQFKESFDYYNQHPVMLDSIYAKVITRLSELEAEWRK